MRNGDSDLFLEIFRRFELNFDPLRFPARGTLQPMLWKNVPFLKTEFAQEIVDALTSFSLNVENCFSAWSEETPSFAFGKNATRFTGAGRCLMRWLINSFFRCSQEEYERRLALLVDFVMTLDVDRRQAAFFSLLSRGQESYFGCVQGETVRGLTRLIHNLSNLPPADLVEEVRNRGKFLSTVNKLVAEEHFTELPQPDPVVVSDTPAARLEPIIELMEQNQKERFQGIRWAEGRYFEELLSCFEAARTSSFTRDDWMEGIALTVFRVAEHACDLCQNGSAVDPVHSFKNELNRWYLPLMERLDPNDDANVNVAKQICSRALQLIALRNGVRTGKEQIVSVGKVLRIYQTRVRLLVPEARINLPKSFLIAGSEAVRKDSLEPLLREIVDNAYGALLDLPPELRRYEVDLVPCPENELFAVLIVRNTFSTDQLNPYSTKKGVVLIQRLAMTIRYGAAAGRAEYNADALIDGLRADATIDSHLSNRIVPGGQGRMAFDAEAADMLWIG